MQRRTNSKESPNQMTTTPETAEETAADVTALEPELLTDDERATVRAMLEGYDSVAYRKYLLARGEAWNVYQATHGRVRTVSRLMREGKPISSQLANELEALAAGDLTKIRLPAVVVPADAKADGRPIDVTPKGRPKRETIERAAVGRRRPRRARVTDAPASDAPNASTDELGTQPEPTGATGAAADVADVADGAARPVRPERMRRVKPPRNAREAQTITAADVGQLPAPAPARAQARRASTAKARPQKPAKDSLASKRREEHGIPRNKRSNG
jgi:hypothetical protein